MVLILFNIYPNITRVRESQRYGLMIKGRTYMYLPNSTRTSIKIGDDLKAGETLIGYFNWDYFIKFIWLILNFV